MKKSLNIYLESAVSTAFLNQGVVISANYRCLDPGQPGVPRPVAVGEHGRLANGVLARPGGETGDQAGTAARPVVRGSLPSRVLAAGHRAEVIGPLDVPDGWRRG